jgi:hypothetical protein
MGLCPQPIRTDLGASAVVSTSTLQHRLLDANNTTARESSWIWGWSIHIGQILLFQHPIDGGGKCTARRRRPAPRCSKSWHEKSWPQSKSQCDPRRISADILQSKFSKKKLGIRVRFVRRGQTRLGFRHGTLPAGRHRRDTCTAHTNLLRRYPSPLPSGYDSTTTQAFCHELSCPSVAILSSLHSLYIYRVRPLDICRPGP